MSNTGIIKHPSAPQAEPGLIAKLRMIAVALLSDQLNRNRGSVGLMPYHSPAPMAGTAVTVRTRGGDNLAILRAYDFCRPGDVMVVDAEGELANALVGGIMTYAAASLGLAGMVLDGAIRDVAEIRKRTFPVYARGVSHRGPYKDGPGAINVPVTVGGMVVNPGDIIVGDQDGLVAFPPALAARVVEKALAQEQNEEGTMQAIREGRWDRSFVDALEARCANQLLERTHGAASFYFLAKAGRMLGAHTFERPVAPVAVDMMQFLGVINVPFVVASLIGAMAPPPLQASLLLTVSLANLSQFAKDLHAHDCGRWKPRLVFITIVDGLFGFVMLALAIWQYLA